MKVIQLKGLDTDLYPLIGPLVMNPKVLKANNNYPFKTTANHQWYIAVNDQEEVMGFLPVENKKRYNCDCIIQALGHIQEIGV